MMKFFKNRSGKSQLILTILVWLLILITPFLFSDFSDDIEWERFIKIVKEYRFVFIIFLINRFILLPYLFFKNKRKAYLLSIAGLILIFTTVLFFQHKRPFDPPQDRSFAPPHRDHPNRARSFKGKQNRDKNSRGDGRRRPKHLRGPNRNGFHHQPNNHKSPIPPFANFFIMSILIIGFDTGLIFSMKWMESEQKKIKAEKESIKHQMAFLKNQVSPHFLMNTLNNIHALIDIDTEEAKEAVIKLSQIMDYMLYETQTNKVSLQREIEFIESYVELMKLRFTDDVEIKIDIPSSLPLVKIPPLLTISFIENAFKYGISYEKESFVHIHFKTDKSRLLFTVKNSVHIKTNKSKNSGIGIQNARNQLDLFYGDDYTLAINNNNNNFEVNLNIPI